MQWILTVDPQTQQAVEKTRERVQDNKPNGQQTQENTPTQLRRRLKQIKQTKNKREDEVAPN